MVVFNVRPLAGGASSQSELMALQKSFAELQDRCAKLSESEKQAVLSAANTVKTFEMEKKAWQEQMLQLKVGCSTCWCLRLV